jgi:hypothetical protein
MFRPPSDHPQAIKIQKIKLRFEFYGFYWLEDYHIVVETCSRVTLQCNIGLICTMLHKGGKIQVLSGLLTYKM